MRKILNLLVLFLATSFVWQSSAQNGGDDLTFESATVFMNFNFLFAKMGMRKIWHVIIILLFAYPFAIINENLAQVTFGFFAGGGTYLIFDLLKKRCPGNFKLRNEIQKIG